MSTSIKQQLKKAINSKKLDINSYIWKGVKKLDTDGKYKQIETRLIDMEKSELLNAYNHCKNMLFNPDKKNPGRYLVLDLISEQKDKCGVELFLRYVTTTQKELTRFTIMNMLSEFMSRNKEAFKNGIKPIVSTAFSALPPEYENLPLSLVIDGCLDRLGAFNRKHITRTFILKQGIWLTPTESKELLDNSENISKNRIDIIKENLSIKDFEILYINSKGLNYTQMRAMLNLKSNKKYSDLTTAQLETLRYRILFSLEEDIKKHIHSWETRMAQIEEVMEHKGFT